MRIFLSALALLFACVDAQAQIRSVATSDPRAIGYLVGDVIDRTIEVKSDKLFRLVPGSLPQPGPLAYWLNLISVEPREHVGGDENVTRIELRYQTFYAPMDTRKQTIPGLALRFANGGMVAVAQVPPWKFTMSPLREVSPGGEGQTLADQLRPDIRPQLNNTWPIERGLIIAGVVAALILLALARHYAAWPFNRRARRPFTRAAAQIGRLRPGDSNERYEASILALHRAFDSAAGKRLLSEDVDTFVGRHPELATTRGQITRFFEASARFFYGADKDGAVTQLPAKDLVAIARVLGEAERRAA